MMSDRTISRRGTFHSIVEFNAFSHTLLVEKMAWEAIKQENIKRKLEILSSATLCAAPPLRPPSVSNRENFYLRRAEMESV